MAKAKGGNAGGAATADPVAGTAATTAADPVAGEQISGATANGDVLEPVAAAAAAAGLDPADLDDDDKAELLAAAEADQARTATTPKAGGRILVREVNGNNSPAAIALLLEACDIYGVNPAADKKPQELLAWRYAKGEDDPARVAPDAVIITTAGGLKIKHWDDPAEPMDQDTMDRLRRVFGCYQIDPKTRTTVVHDLPADLTLPAAVVTGTGTSDAHRYQGGYLKSGGKRAADEKQARRAERIKRAGLQ
jgi:hypothetical protein